jgi:hypothetical protein
MDADELSVEGHPIRLLVRKRALRSCVPAREATDGGGVGAAVQRDSFKSRYGNVFEGPPQWRAVTGAGGMTYDFQDASTYLALPPYFENMPAAALFREHAKGAGRAKRRQRRARAGDLWRQHHD